MESTKRRHLESDLRREKKANKGRSTIAPGIMSRSALETISSQFLNSNRCEIVPQFQYWRFSDVSQRVNGDELFI